MLAPLLLLVLATRAAGSWAPKPHAAVHGNTGTPGQRPSRRLGAALLTRGGARRSDEAPTDTAVPASLHRTLARASLQAALQTRGGARRGDDAPADPAAPAARAAPPGETPRKRNPVALGLAYLGIAMVPFLPLYPVAAVGGSMFGMAALPVVSLAQALAALLSYLVGRWLSAYVGRTILPLLC
jgi:hypothetical protein